MESFKITPLGGVGEIGALNCMVYETAEEAVVVDCGSQFPDDETLGVDLIIPDFTYLKSIEKKLRGIVLTHGHEDHVGGVPFFLREFDVPIYGSPFTLGLVRRKMEECPWNCGYTYKPFQPGETIQVGSFCIDTIFVNHSIIDACALAIHTSLGAVVHLTDWKIDRQSELMTDVKKFSALGKKGVLALLSDSTNVYQLGSTLSEKAIAQKLKKICTAHQGRILVTLFASNINRIQALAGVARLTGRKMAFVGRSMHENTTLARSQGKLDLDGVTLLPIEETEHIPPQELIVLLTGSQGEERSALTRIAYNQFKPFQIHSGDLVLFSSKIIPGNEKNIFGVIDSLYRHGAKVLYESVHEIHTSGHAHQDELKEAIKRLKPKYFIPIHGSYRHFVKHAELAQKCGVKDDHILITENGYPLSFDKEGCERLEEIPTGRVFVDGSGVGDVSDLVLRDRKHLSDTGIVICILMLDRVTGDVVRGPELICRGFTDEKENGLILEQAKSKLLDLLSEKKREDKTDLVAMQEEVRLTLRRFFKKELERKPVLIPVVLEV